MKKLFVAVALLATALLASCSVIERDPSEPGASASPREAARIGLWQLAASFEAGLDAAAGCAEDGLLTPDQARDLRDAAVVGRAALELVRLGVALSDAVVPAGADAPAPVVETASVSGQLGGALLTLDELTRATACAVQIRTSLALVQDQAAVRFGAGVAPPPVAFADAAFQVDHHLQRLDAVAQP